MSTNPTEEPEAQHLEVQPYEEHERVERPEWYNDFINVGDGANAFAETQEEGRA